MQRPTRHLLCALLASSLLIATFSRGGDEKRPLFVFDNGLTRTPGLEQKAALLKELGYDGMSGRPGRTADLLKALDAHGLKQVLRLVRKANHPNLGASFNLCHFPKLDDEKNLEAVLREAAPDLKLVQISGADSGDTKNMDWSRLIQPVGKGTLDMRGLLNILDDIGYRGPICLQCFKIPGDDRANLKHSIDALGAMQEGR